MILHVTFCLLPYVVIIFIDICAERAGIVEIFLIVHTATKQRYRFIIVIVEDQFNHFAMGIPTTLSQSWRDHWHAVGVRRAD